MVRVVTAMGGEVEGDRHALLPRGEVAAGGGIRIFRGGEARILPDRPRPLHIHGGIGAAQIGRDAGEAVEEIETSGITRAVDRLYCDALRRLPSSRRVGRGEAGALLALEFHVC